MTISRFFVTVVGVSVLSLTLTSLTGLTGLSLGSVWAADANGGVPGEPNIDGCGLGWQVTRDRTMMGSLTRGTTNATVPPSFGMSSGTLGCAKLPISENDQKAVKYAYANLDALSIDMAAGQGEYLQAFAETLGCGEVARPFSNMAQAHFKSITADGRANAIELFKNVKSEIQKDPLLASRCGA